ncbi:unnamed protein product [Lampetra fluviatilis]
MGERHKRAAHWPIGASRSSSPKTSQLRTLDPLVPLVLVRAGTLCGPVVGLWDSRLYVLELDREGRLRSELRPAGRLGLIFSSTGRVDSGARSGGSTQERAATSGSARLFSSSGTQPSSIGSPELALGARLKRLPISSAGGQDPLDSSTRPAWVNLCRVGGLCCRRSGEDRGLATRLVLTLVDDPTLHAASELWAPPTDRVPNCDSVSTGIHQFTTVTGERLIRMTRTAPSPHDHQASV